MSLTWLLNTNWKKPKHPKPNGREENQVQVRHKERERDSTPFMATTELLSAVSPPLSRWCLGGSAALFNLGMSLPCQAPTIFLPQFVADPSPKPQASIADPFRRLYLCFGMGFAVYVCVSEWISGCVCVLVWVLAFVFVFRRGFQAGFRALFAFWVCVSGVGFSLSLRFGLGFCWLFSICWFRFGLFIFLLFFFLVFLIWVLLIFLLVFSGFSAQFFLFFFTGSWWVLVIVVALWLCGGFQIEQCGETGFFCICIWKSCEWHILISLVF